MLAGGTVLRQITPQSAPSVLATDIFAKLKKLRRLGSIIVADTRLSIVTIKTSEGISMRGGTSKWDYWNRAMIVVGTVATIGSFLVAAYAMAVPGTVSNLLRAILNRMEQDVSLPDRDRFGLAAFACSQVELCTVAVAKFDTSSSVQVDIELCSPDGRLQGERKSFGMMRAQGAINTKMHYPYKEYHDLEVRLIINHGGDVFTIVTPLRAEGSSDYPTFNPPKSPTVLSGDRGCLP